MKVTLDEANKMAVPKKIYHGIENVFCGRKEISLQRLCKEYASDVFGSEVFWPWLYLYSGVSGGFKNGWLPGGYFHSFVSPRINGDYGKIASLTGLPKVLFDGSKFPDVLYFVNGVFLDLDRNVVKESSVYEFLYQDADTVWFKSDNSSEGRGVWSIKRENFDLDNVRNLGNGAFQLDIQQHSVFSGLCPSAVATIRLVTVYSNGRAECEVRAGYLRVARINENHVSSSTQISIPIDLNTGQLESKGWFHDYGSSEVHPDSGVRFRDVRIPSFRQCVEEVVSLHASIPFVGLVGWDVTIDRDEEMRIIEWNAESPSVTFIEATQGPCFSDLNWQSFAKTRV